MEWLIIPAIISILFINSWLWGNWDRWNGNVPIVTTIVFSFLLIVVWITYPVGYYSTRNTAWQMEAYYENVIQPNVVVETDGYVVVENIEAGIWQAGDTNIWGYNSYLKVTRHWQEVAIVKWGIFRVPEHLKYVRIGYPNK